MTGSEHDALSAEFNRRRCPLDLTAKCRLQYGPRAERTDLD